MYDLLVNVIIMYLLVILLAAAVSLTNYLLRGFGLYGIGKRQGKDNCWFAFIPYLNTYFRGELSGPVLFKNKRIEHPGLWIIIISVVYGSISGVISGVVWQAMVMRLVQTIEYGSSQSTEYILSSILGQRLGAFIVICIIISILATAVTAAVNILNTVIDYQIYRRFTSQNMAIFHAVCSIFIPFYEAVCLFIFRRKPYYPHDVHKFNEMPIE